MCSHLLTHHPEPYDAWRFVSIPKTLVLPAHLIVLSSWPVAKHNLTPVRCSDSAFGSGLSPNMTWRQSLPTHHRNQFRLYTQPDRSATLVLTHSAQHTCMSHLCTGSPTHNPTHLLELGEWRRSCDYHQIMHSNFELRSTFTSCCICQVFLIIMTLVQIYYNKLPVRGPEVNLTRQTLVWINKTNSLEFADSSI